MSTLANSMKKVASFSRFPSRVWPKEAKRGKITTRRKRKWKKILDNKFKKLKERSYSLSDGKQISHSCNKKFCESSSFVCLYGGGDLQCLSEARGSIVETCFIFPFIVAKEQRFLDDQRAIYLTPRLR